ncbi:MAG: outer membrane protein assembly factor BamD [Acidobacteriota bacterium]
MADDRRTLRSASAALIVLAAVASGCAGKKDVVPTGILEADRFLYERGIELLENRKWTQARQYFEELLDNYPQSAHRPDAKIGLGDSYIGEGSIESLLVAQNQFREFLTFYPTHARADYAQYRLGFTHYKQMLGADRDQTETKEAIAEWTIFMERYPNSALREEVAQKLREAKDRLSESDYRVGYFYYRAKWYPGAIDRFKEVLSRDPEYSRRDAVYFYLAESLMKVGIPAEALAYYDRLVKEFAESEHLEDAKKQIAAIKAAMGESKKDRVEPSASGADALGLQPSGADWP